MLELIGGLIALILFVIMLFLAYSMKDIHAIRVLAQGRVDNPNQVSSCDVYKALGCNPTTDQGIKLTVAKN